MFDYFLTNITFIGLHERKHKHKLIARGEDSKPKRSKYFHDYNTNDE